MLIANSLDNWKRAKHSPRIQAKAIRFIASKIELAEAYSHSDDDVRPCLQYILEDCKATVTPDVSVVTLRRWWNTYEEWGELPYLARRRKVALEKKMKGLNNKEIPDSVLLILKRLVDNNPNIF